MKIGYLKSSSSLYISASNRKVCAENCISNSKTTTELMKEDPTALTYEHSNSRWMPFC
jgi:hypothetical protein